MDPDDNGITLPYIPTTPPPTTTPTCITPSNAAALFIEAGVLLETTRDNIQANPVGICKNSPNGMTAYYNGLTPNQYDYDNKHPLVMW
uniref:Uncharacterized protein n=1 Tax=Panagrolaimus sp. ES5 TaxID=591445 RepID=A0AC34FZZ0_9BILA